MLFAKELVNISDICPSVLQFAVEDLLKLRATDKLGLVPLSLVVSYANIVEGKNAINKYTECTNPVTVVLKPVDFLKDDAWFLTDGEHVIWSPGF